MPSICRKKYPKKKVRRFLTAEFQKSSENFKRNPEIFKSNFPLRSLLLPQSRLWFGGGVMRRIDVPSCRPADPRRDRPTTLALAAKACGDVMTASYSTALVWGPRGMFGPGKASHWTARRCQNRACKKMRSRHAPGVAAASFCQRGASARRDGRAPAMASRPAPGRPRETSARRRAEQLGSPAPLLAGLRRCSSRFC